MRLERRRRIAGFPPPMNKEVNDLSDGKQNEVLYKLIFKSRCSSLGLEYQTFLCARPSHGYNCNISCVYVWVIPVMLRLCCARLWRLWRKEEWRPERPDHDAVQDPSMAE
ncbi:hypothetical protein L249_7786 [Ophiocordyceps polyrhachis-furcata BCC 54312]|uniref:Uncharacterized protein n=1 Tax=Ophiocordyceps polyrhachis-furcata BCC 54312 TaxID=1330021 RepID=A0A367LAD6_9HYPO|nr:hypothetical protein L249_7786 [Ophiocordyceps polyrhachis-furcata BCC 54312]